MSVQFQDYYKTLGVPRTATQDEIKKAYRRLARQFHPDVNKQPGAETRFKEIGEAYEVLRDPEKRKRYDALGSNWRAGQDFTPPPGWEGMRFHFGGARPGAGRGVRFENLGGEFGGFSDFFEMLFGGTGGGMSGEDLFGEGFSQMDSGGADLEATLTISIEDAYHGARKSISLKPADQPGARARRYDVRIPAGTTEGSVIRLAGQGGRRGRSAKPGDLRLQIHLEPHPVFRVKGHDLETDLRLAPWEAALGCKVNVPIVDGKASITVPAGTQSGRRIRLRGKGLPRPRGAQPGDLYAITRIVVPDQLTARERALFESLARESGFRPRD